MSVLYLTALLVSLLGLGLADYRYKLALFGDLSRAVRTLIICIGFFLAWDVAGIMLDIFFTGTSPYIMRWFIAPDLPIEELFFLAVLAYSTMVVYRWLEEKL